MKKIVVPTDFSPASKYGVKFAIKWASQQNVELVFIHVLNVLIPTRWSEGAKAKYISGKVEACRSHFRKFVESIYKKMDERPGAYSLVIVQEYDPVKAILDYCRKDISVDCICISTNGAGPVRKLFGTNTSGLIEKSPLPVLAIPINNKLKEVKSILYATDFRNYKDELAKVLHFATLFKAKVDVVHLTWPGEWLFDEDALQKLSGEYQYGLNVYVDESNDSTSLKERLQNAILKRKPSVVIMFSNKERNLMQKIFLSSNTEELSFSLKTPLLVYCKAEAALKTKKHAWP